MTIADLKIILNELPDEADDAELRNEAGVSITSLEHYEGAGAFGLDHLPTVIMRTE